MAMLALALVIGQATATAGGKKDKPRPAFTLDKQHEALRKEGYKNMYTMNGRVTKEHIKMAKQDGAIIHGAWVQGQTQSWDKYFNPLPIPQGYVAVKMYSDSLYVIRNMQVDKWTNPTYDLYNTKQQRIITSGDAENMLRVIHYYNSVATQTYDNGVYTTELRTLDGAHSTKMSSNEVWPTPMAVFDHCMADTIDPANMAYAKAYTQWAQTPDNIDDDKQYRDNNWLMLMFDCFAKKDYSKALICIEQFTAFDLDAMANTEGMLAYRIKSTKANCLLKLGRYKELLKDFSSAANGIATGMNYSTITHDMSCSVLVSDEVKSTYAISMNRLCQQAQQLQAQREQQNAAMWGAIFGAVAGTVSNIAGGGSSSAATSVSTSSAYSSGSAAQASQQRSSTGSSSRSSSSSSSASAPAAKRQVQCRACSGRGFVIDERNAGERKYCSKCGETRQAHTHKTCGACKGKGYKEQ